MESTLRISNSAIETEDEAFFQGLYPPHSYKNSAPSQPDPLSFLLRLTECSHISHLYYEHNLTFKAPCVGWMTFHTVRANGPKGNR